MTSPLMLIASLQPDAMHLKKLLAESAGKKPKSVLVLVGPDSLSASSSQRLRAVGAAVLGARPYTAVPGYLQHADVLVVLSGGQLIEEGDHQNLMARGGVYAEMFEMQAASYR